MTALALIPAYTPPLPDDRHLTLVWAGDLAPSSVTAALAIVGASWAKNNQAFSAKVLGTALFGTNHNEPVLLVELTPEIALLRSAVQQYSKSEYTEFRPHVAVPKVPVKKRPKCLYFNQMALWAGAGHREGETLWWLGG